MEHKIENEEIGDKMDRNRKQQPPAQPPQHAKYGTVGKSHDHSGQAAWDTFDVDKAKDERLQQNGNPIVPEGKTERILINSAEEDFLRERIDGRKKNGENDQFNVEYFRVEQVDIIFYRIVGVNGPQVQCRQAKGQDQERGEQGLTCSPAPSVPG